MSSNHQGKRQVGEAIGALLAVVAVLAAACSLVAAVVGYQPAFVAPVVVQAILIVAAVVVAKVKMSRLALNGLILLTAFEWLRGCLVPLLVQLVGQIAPVYRQLGTTTDSVTILFLGNLFFAMVVATCAILPSERDTTAPLEQQSELRAAYADSARSIRWLLVVVGFIGLVLRFPNIEALQGFLAGDYEYLQSGDGVPGFVSAVTRPLLPLGLALFALKSQRSSPFRIVLTLVAVAITAFLALGSFGLNRSAILFPAAAFLLAMMRVSTRKVPAAPVIVGGGLLGVAFFYLGSVRQTLYADRIGLTADTGSLVNSLVQVILNYGQSPLQSAPALAADQAFTVQSLFYSVVNPLPGLPDAWRSANGVSIYNSLLYQNAVTKDQILPSWLEAYLSIGVLGIVVLGVLTALLLRLTDRARVNSKSVLGGYAAALATIWIVQLSINSLSALGQGMVYFVVVPGVIALVTHRRAGRRVQPVMDKIRA